MNEITKFNQDLWENESDSYHVKNHKSDWKTRWRRKWLAKYIHKLCKELKKTDIRILELGCNEGSNLREIYKKKKYNLYGLDINARAMEYGKKLNGEMNYIVGSIYDLSKLADFDIVFTMGVLMHIPPEGLETIRDEILKLNPKFIVHCENHSKNPQPTAIYQGKPVQFSHDYGKLYKGYKITITDKVRCPGGGANHLITIDL